MTAVVGFMNKRGVAIAADSAVTRTRSNTEKVTKNGNKMVRICNATPIAVMFTGNGDFHRITWDIIARRYRQQRGDIMHPTVEACVHDFFDYIAHNQQFFNEDYAHFWIHHLLEDIFSMIVNNHLSEEALERDESYALIDSSLFGKELRLELKKYRCWLNKRGLCPAFKDYTLEQFKQYTDELIDEFVNDGYDEDSGFIVGFPKSVLLRLREDIQLTLMSRLIHRDHGDNNAELIFSGFGAEQQYPSLIATCVFEGFDARVCYHINDEDKICISDKRPVAFCPFAQKDVMRAIIRGIYSDFSSKMEYALGYAYHTLESSFSQQDVQDIPGGDPWEINQQIQNIPNNDLRDQYLDMCRRYLDHNQRGWENKLKNYDLESLADLAESLIELTAFHRILTFQPEGVGGPIDLAVISKQDGFTWLNRKSWYHGKDIGGRYGSLGV